MKRKVIQIADSTQLVSLPRKWALQHGVKKGDEINVDINRDQVIISVSDAFEGEKKLNLNIEDSSKFLRRFLFSPYIQGYTEISITYKDRKTFDLILEELELLMGYEIIHQGAGSCTIKRIATAMDNDFDNILNRIFMSAMSMMEGIIEALKEKDAEKLNSLAAMELINNKLSYFCLRVLNTQGYKDAMKTNSLYYIILMIEQITDDLRDICLYMHQTKFHMEKSTIDLLAKTADLFGQVYKLFKEFNNDILIELNKTVKELIKEITKRVGNNPKDAIVISYIHKIADNASHISKEIHY